MNMELRRYKEKKKDEIPEKKEVKNEMKNYEFHKTWTDKRIKIIKE